MLNELKYKILSARNRETDMTIPDDEPVFLLRARDNLAIDTLVSYFASCKSSKCRESHLQGVVNAIESFSVWRVNNRQKTQTPD